MRRKSYRALACAAAAATLLAACGGGGSDSGGSTAAPVGTTSDAGDQQLPGDSAGSTPPGTGSPSTPTTPPAPEPGGLTTEIEPPAPSATTNLYDSVAAWMSRTLSSPIVPQLQPSSSSKTPATQQKASPSANLLGSWSLPQKWPLVGIHAALLPDGRVMSYGTNAAGDQTGKFIYDLWDSSSPNQDTGHMTLPNVTPTDLFCNAQTLLAGSGQLFLAGGDNFVNGRTTNTGNNNTAIFNPQDNKLQSGTNLNRARWYASLTTLSDASLYISGGLDGTDRPEVREGNGQVRLLGDADTSRFNFWYPRTFLARDDRIFGLDVDGRMFFADARDNGYIQNLANVHPDFMSNSSTAAMYAPGEILQVGGYSNRVATISIERPVPLLAETSPTSTARQWGTATVLPDGRVLVTGGSAKDNELIDVNNTAELWDPDTGKWTQGASGALPRLYHSSALLLPDASVLIMGGGTPGPYLNANAERYSPPYLFASNGEVAQRPRITSSPDSLTPGQRVSIGVESESRISKVVLIRTGSVTHSFNFDQRRVVLDHQQEGGTILAQLPASGTTLPPGFYMLFMLDASGVPSVAKIVRINEGDANAIQADWIGTIGGNGGTQFKSECGGNEVLIGLYGYSPAQLRSVGAICIRANSAGEWEGDASIGTVVGGTEGALYTTVCPANQAVVGFAGRSNDLAQAIGLTCEPLANANKASGRPTKLGDIGSASDGTQRPYRRCSAEGVARGVYGKAGGLIDNVGLLCRAEDKSNAFAFFSATRTKVRGDTSDSAYSLSCHSDEVLAGLSGRSGAWTDKISPLCVKVNEFGKWTSDVVARGAAGGNGGAAFTRLCPTDQMVSGLTAETDRYVNRIALRCQAAVSPGRLSGPTTSLPITPGNAATAGDADCPNEMPAHGISGHAGNFVGAVALECRGQAI